MYEAAAEFGDIGVALGMPWRPWTILKLLDLQKYLLPLLKEVPTDDMGESRLPVEQRTCGQLTVVLQSRQSTTANLIKLKVKTSLRAWV